MKIEDLELYLSNIVGSYYAVREKLMENDDEYHSRIDTPISTEGIVALNDVLARIRKRYQKPLAEDLEWPENLMFDIGFDLSIRVTDKQMAGIEYVLTLLTDEESAVITGTYRDKKEVAQIVKENHSSREGVRLTKERALRKLRMPAWMHIVEEGPDVLVDYQKKREQLRTLSDEYAKQITVLTKDKELLQLVLEGNPTPEAIKAYTDAAKRRESLMHESIEELQLTVRSYNCLKRAGYEYIGQLLGISKKKLAMVRNLGEKSMQEVIERLREYDIIVEDE